MLGSGMVTQHIEGRSWVLDSPRSGDHLSYCNTSFKVTPGPVLRKLAWEGCAPCLDIGPNVSGQLRGKSTPAVSML